MTKSVLVPDIELAPTVSREYLIYHRLCPLRRHDDGRVAVAVGPGAIRFGLGDLATAYGAEILEEDASNDDIDRYIERLITRTERMVEIDRDETDDYSADVRALADQPPVIRYLNLIIRDAYDFGASDIHLEATRAGLSARFRIDGVLTPAPEAQAELHHAIVSRVKLLAELDIAERRRPQDGRIRVRLGTGELDLRVSTVPTMFGESVVLRLLDRGSRPADLEELGMDGETLSSVERIAARPHGMVLVTGPTGSGKTTTLYGCLARRTAAAEKIITVEDPIEYQLAQVTQVPVQRQAGVSFATALRSILRQDPDVIMIGEMRDAETAEIAVQSAMTGHLVFSTLHTNDAVAAIPRLMDLGVPDYLVSATLEGVLAQRLVRRICDECRTSYRAPGELVARVAGEPVGSMSLQRGIGCAACRGTGFRQRIGLFELLVIDDALKDAIAVSAPRSELRRLAKAAGMVTLRESGWQKVHAGLTTVDEVLRVVET